MSETPRFFLHDVTDADPEYLFLRDHECAADRRALIEAQWARYQEFCGDGIERFREEAALHTCGRLWEMAVACLLLDHGHRLGKPPSEDSPDIKLIRASHTVWVEATVAERGGGPDAVEESHEGMVVPDHPRMILRYTNAIQAKNLQLDECEKRGHVRADEPTIIALCAAPIPHSDVEPGGVPDILKAVFGLAETQYVLPVLGARGPVRTRVPRRLKIQKQSGKFVPSTWFVQALADHISAILFFPYAPLKIGEAWSVSVVHNPRARVALQRGLFRFGREWWIDPETSALRCTYWRDIPRWARRNGLAPVAMRVAQTAERVGRRYRAMRDRVCSRRLEERRGQADRKPRGRTLRC